MNNPRFVTCIGPIYEEYPDIPRSMTEYGDRVVIWDRQEKAIVATFHAPYLQLICLETTREPNGAPFTALENWLNSLNKKCMESEGNVATNRRKYGCHPE